MLDSPNPNSILWLDSFSFFVGTFVYRYEIPTNIKRYKTNKCTCGNPVCTFPALEVTPYTQTVWLPRLMALVRLIYLGFLENFGPPIFIYFYTFLHIFHIIFIYVLYAFIHFHAYIYIYIHICVCFIKIFSMITLGFIISTPPLGPLQKYIFHPPRAIYTSEYIRYVQRYAGISTETQGKSTKNYKIHSGGAKRPHPRRRRGCGFCLLFCWFSPCVSVDIPAYLCTYLIYSDL